VELLRYKMETCEERSNAGMRWIRHDKVSRVCPGIKGKTSKKFQQKNASLEVRSIWRRTAEFSSDSESDSPGLRIPDQFVCLPTSAHPSPMLVAELPPHSVRNDYCTSMCGTSAFETKTSMFGTSMFGNSKAERKEPDTADNISLSPPGPNFGLVHRVVFVDAWW